MNLLRLTLRRAAGLPILVAGLLAASLVVVSTSKAQRRSARPTPTPIPTPVPTIDDPVTLPYGFTWGDSTEMVKTALPRVKGKVKEIRPLGERGEIWVVTGIEVPGLRESRAIFQERQLVGLDLEYGAPDWPMEKFRAAMANLRRKLEAMFAGPGTLLKRGPVEGTEESGVDQILTGYEWRRGDTIVLLVYFSAEKRDGETTKDAFRSMTIRYRYQQPSPDPSPAPSPPATPGQDPLPEPAPDSNQVTPVPEPPK
jgi:hypothetical protein